MLWLRGKPFTTFGPALVVVAGIAVGLGLIPWDQAMLGLAVQTKQSLAWVFGGLAITIIAGAFASSLILDDFECMWFKEQICLNRFTINWAF